MTDEFERVVVTRWIDGSIPNNGVMVKHDNEYPSDNTLCIMFQKGHLQTQQLTSILFVQN